MPLQSREKVVWFHSGMSMDFHVDAMDKLRRGDIWGVCCTDAAGMVSRGPWTDGYLSSQYMH
jgi:hypothetical protein